MNRTALSLLTFVTLLPLGCSSMQIGGHHCGVVDELVLLTSPSALNLDGQPGVDGFTARVYVLCRHQAKGMVLDEGELEFELYGGIHHRSQLAELSPRQTWSYSAPELPTHRTESMLGVGYFFVVQWTPDVVVREEDITVRVRYKGRLSGDTVVSAPLSLAVRVKRVRGVSGS